MNTDNLDESLESLQQKINMQNGAIALNKRLLAQSQQQREQLFDLVSKQQAPKTQPVEEEEDRFKKFQRKQAEAEQLNEQIKQPKTRRPVEEDAKDSLEKIRREYAEAKQQQKQTNQPKTAETQIATPKPTGTVHKQLVQLLDGLDKNEKTENQFVKLILYKNTIASVILPLYIRGELDRMWFDALLHESQQIQDLSNEVKSSISKTISFFNSQFDFDEMNEHIVDGPFVSPPILQTTCNHYCMYQHALLFLKRRYQWSETYMKKFLDIVGSTTSAREMVRVFVPDIFASV
jgi:uncharacterized protein YfkK (UPF0435 family)